MNISSLYKPIRIVLVGQYSIIQYALEKLIDQQNSTMAVVGNYSNCTESLLNLDKDSPNIIIINPNLEEEKYLEAIFDLIVKTHAKVLIFKWLQHAEIYDKFLLAGARGFLEKEFPLDTIIKAIEKVHEGQLWLSQSTIIRLLNELSLQSLKKSHLQNKDEIHKLTPKEKKVFFTMIENVELPGKIVAARLNISESTLRNHLTSIYDKLNIHNKSELRSYVDKHKLK
ncbi:MAG TPA: response regulator transcription factor [Nitrosomonas sp.]|nr:response regulator transcription factor [Nitrosomonas sp.]